MPVSVIHHSFLLAEITIVHFIDEITDAEEQCNHSTNLQDKETDFVWFRKKEFIKRIVKLI